MTILSEADLVDVPAGDFLAMPIHIGPLMSRPVDGTGDISLNGFIPRILVADNHYIIGLEAQRIISEARACSVEICRRDDLAKALTTQYDLVFVDAAPTPQAQKQQAEMVIAARAGLVFIHAGHLDDQAGLEEEALAVFEKPFNEEEIRHFIQSIDLGPDAIP